MKEPPYKTGLLEYLAEKTGCGYLSDLHSKKMGIYIYEVTAEIAPSDYGLEEWEDAVSYITGAAVSFDDSYQAVKYLLNYLKN